MGDAGARAGDDGWHLVVAHPATEIREEKQIAEWERSKGSWSGAGKHPIQWGDHKTMRVQDRELGAGSYGVVERITYKTVTMARKHVIPKRYMKVEELRKEVNAMERLAHKHILKLVGTYTLKRNDLFILLYPAAVCDLSKFLEDIDDLRSGSCSDREDAFNRLHALGLKDIGTIADLAVLRHPTHPATAPPRTATAVGFLQQILGCITEALAYVHEKDIRHRDLKPKNILLSPGRVYLADFGIAKDVRESENSITDGRYGTPSWIAPEVHEEQLHHMSPADIWPLGCIFLNIATILYGEPLEKYDEIMKERDWTRKYELLPRYLGILRSKATAAALRDQDEPNFDAKNILKLIESMLQKSAAARPTAHAVNAQLCEFGGLDQVYHLPCCHKKNVYVSGIINNKLNSIWQNNAASLAEISQLKNENRMIKGRLGALESINSTFEQRLKSERDHLGEQYKALQERYEKEVKDRKLLEERLKSLEPRPNRRQRSENRGRGRVNGFFRGNSNNNTNAIVVVNPSRPINSGQNPASPNIPRRASGLPQPIRPSTPMRPVHDRNEYSNGSVTVVPARTPNRPPLDRDPGSNSSTLRSSIHSTFSQTSVQTNESYSSVESNTMRSSSPASPTRIVAPRPPVPQFWDPVTSFEKLSVVKVQDTQPPRPSWANVVRSASHI